VSWEINSIAMRLRRKVPTKNLVSKLIRYLFAF
jgi:hypothetical protein